MGTNDHWFDYQIEDFSRIHPSIQEVRRMDPRDLLPPPEHPYFVSSRPEKRRDKKIGELQSNLSKKMQIFSTASGRRINIEKSY